MKHHAYRRWLGLSLETGTWLLASLCLIGFPILILIGEILR